MYLWGQKPHSIPPQTVSVQQLLIRNSFLIPAQNFSWCKLCPFAFISWKILWLHLLCNTPLDNWKRPLQDFYLPAELGSLSFAAHQRQIRMCYPTPGPLQKADSRWSAGWGERKRIFIHLNLHFQPQLLNTAEFQEVWFQTSAVFLYSHNSCSGPTSGAAKEGEHKTPSFVLPPAQQNRGNSWVSLGTGRHREAARPRRWGCRWKNGTLPRSGVFQHSLCFFYTSTDLALVLHASVGKYTEEKKNRELNLKAFWRKDCLSWTFHIVPHRLSNLKQGVHKEVVVLLNSFEKNTYEKNPQLALRAINGLAPPSKEIPLILTLGYEHGPLPV